ncbi:MAG: hypothetical protein WBJ42_06995 [Thermovirgaceae bacterium]|nr:hypothetical protein [Synergistales bacterium]HPC76101.1 hypothetical protein [Synergistales bacterium]HRS48777.1 hypothetical protein [Thermovirgaceae bacterium]HRU90982.1 hypothetical protein [Thermovirgaceae bacterium]
MTKERDTIHDIFQEKQRRNQALFRQAILKQKPPKKEESEKQEEEVLYSEVEKRLHELEEDLKKMR